jgi:hypothetical protein
MKRNFAYRSRANVVRVAIFVLPLFLITSNVLTQNPSPTGNKEVPLNELLKLPGKVLAEAQSLRGIGNTKLTGYRIEELALPRSLTVDLHGKQVTTNKAWRVTINGGPFPVRDLPAVVWIEDDVVGYGIENSTLSQISAVTFDGSLIREGAVVSLSYGEDKEARVKLPQRVQLKAEGGKQ